MAELALWQRAGIEIGKAKGRWYRDTGHGMGPALNTASAMGAYVLSDRGTWLAFQNRGDLDEYLVEGDKRLFNQYGVMLVNPAKHPNVKKGIRAAIHRLAGLRRGRRRSPITRSMASSCSIPMPATPPHEASRHLDRIRVPAEQCGVDARTSRCGCTPPEA